MRPPSIRMFQSLWSAMLLFLLANMALGWNAARRMMAARLPGNDPAVLALIADALGLVVPLLVLIFVLRRSPVARGVAVLLSAYNAWILASAFASGRFGGGFLLVLSVVCVLLEIAATMMLFRRDARAWFAKDGDQQPDI